MNFFQIEWPARRITADEYELLPSSQAEDATARHAPRTRRCVTGTHSGYFSAVVATVLLLGTFYALRSRRLGPHQAVDPQLASEFPVAEDNGPRKPPSYREYHQRERAFPQHNLSLPYPDGSHAKFLWTANHGSSFGWGNYMQETILDAYLAYAAKRAYVFDNYTWARDGPEITKWKGRPIPARIPLSALISGPIIGGPMRDQDVPRAVSREYFSSVCPESERVVLDTREVQSGLGAKATVSEIVDRWVTELQSIESPCVELKRSSPTLFSDEITNTLRVLDVFPALSSSPILSDFGWSPLIIEGYYTNLPHFTTSLGFEELPSMRETPTDPLRGLLAIHVRRGDNETWCSDAYRHRMSFTGFNSFPALPDKYVPPEGEDTAANVEHTQRHCLPSIPQIVEKVLAVNAPHMTRVYVMTNAPRPWLEDLKGALSVAHSWADGVRTNRNLELSWEQKFVAEAVDMYVGQRAEKFIGNGFSSLTSNVVLLRMHNRDLNPSDTHFW
ncbi:hypothetical protein C8R46DRAFT_1287610 [Mycena filopes]|nr:hypothetical protein C8R46DRAFT_1287610 [Mycena filopes]